MTKHATKWKVSISIITAAVLVYLVVSFVSSSFSMVHTETVKAATVTNSINTSGYIVRDETYITNDTSGVVVYQLQSGGSIAVGGVVAKVYASEKDAAAYQKMDELTVEIERLKKLNTTAKLQGASLETINTKIHDNLADVIYDFHNKNYYELQQERSNLLYVLNERQILTGSVDSFNTRITQLEQEKSDLQTSAKAPIAEITSPVAGYFVEYTDGFENSFSYNKVKNMTISQLGKLEEAKAKDVPQNAIGKIVSKLNWYICCNVTAKEAEEFSGIQGGVSVHMPYATTETVPVNVVSINQQNKEDNAAIILECRYMSDQLATLRNEPVNIDVQSFEGIKVPKRALRFDTLIKPIEKKDGTTTSETESVEGVYVLFGNEIEFKQVIIIYNNEDEDYVICDLDPDDESLFLGSARYTVKLYDQVVVEGVDLYDGKIVKQATG